MPFERHIPDPNVPPPKKRQKSAINRLLTVALDLAENSSLGEAQRLQAARLGADIWDKRPRPRRKSDKEKALLNALSGSKGKTKRPDPKTEP